MIQTKLKIDLYDWKQIEERAARQMRDALVLLETAKFYIKKLEKKEKYRSKHDTAAL